MWRCAMCVRVYCGRKIVMNFYCFCVVFAAVAVAVVGLFIMIAIRWNRPFPNSSQYIDGKFQHYIFYTLYIYNTTMYTLYYYHHTFSCFCFGFGCYIATVAVGGANRPMFSISFSFIEYIGLCRRHCRQCRCSMFIR